MKPSTKVLLFFLLVTINIAVVSAGYTVTPYSPPTGPYDATGADANVSFFQLPHWIQISWIIGLLFAFIATIKFGPLVLGRIKNLLKNKNRLAILDYIGDHPGCTITDLSMNTQINRGTVKYHLSLLLIERKIVRINDGNRIYLFKNGGICFEKKHVLGYIQNPTKRQILSVILNEPGISNTAIAEKLELDKSSIYRHLCQFLDEKMVECHWNGKNMCYHVTPDVEKILNESSFREV
jgi:predicted transcriptional regulator